MSAAPVRVGVLSLHESNETKAILNAVAANVEDRSHMNHAVLFGRDVLEHYRLDVSRRVDEDERPVPVEGEE